MFAFNSLLMTNVKADIQCGNIPMLLGEPGIGKSSWVQALGDVLHTKVFVLACNQLADKADLTGARLVPCETNKEGAIAYKQVFYPHAVIAEAIDYANEHPRETPILFMDELNRTTPDVTSEALSIPTLRAIGSIKLPNNLKVITAGNDKGNITSLDEASISRFVLYHVTPDAGTFLSLDPDMNVFVKEVISKNPTLLFCKANISADRYNDPDADLEDTPVDIDAIIDDGEMMNQFTTPRTIMGVSRWLNCFSNKELMEMLAVTHTEEGHEVSMLQEALEGHCGKTNFTKLLLAEVAQGINTVNNQANATTVGKPTCVDDMKAILANGGQVSEIENLVSTLTSNDKSGAIVYLLYEKEDNGILIKTLAKQMEISDLQPTDMNKLMMLASHDEIDTENRAAFLNTQSGVRSVIGTILGDYQ